MTFELGRIMCKVADLREFAEEKCATKEDHDFIIGIADAIEEMCEVLVVQPAAKAVAP